MNQPPLPPKPKKISPALLPLAKVVDPIDAELMGLKPPLVEPPLQSGREPPLQGEPPLQSGGEPPLSVQGEPPLKWDPAMVAEAGRERVRHKVPDDLSYVVPPCNGRRLPSMPVHGRRTRACITLDRDVYLATAQRALEYRLSVSACINYALAQWLGKSPSPLV